MAGAVSLGIHDGEVPELGRLQHLLAESGHTLCLVAGRTRMAALGLSP
jgi:hypothetical protein